MVLGYHALMWILFSLLSALGQASQLTMGKKLMQKYSSWFVTWTAMAVLAVIMLIAGVFLYEGLPWSNLQFVVGMFFAIVPYVVALLIIIESTKRCDLSIVAPIVALTPIFLVVIEFFWRGSVPNGYGFIGIGLVVFGGYVLNISKARGGNWLEPVKSIFRRGSGLLALTGAFLFAFSAAGCKVALDYAEVSSFTIVMYMISFLFMSFIYGVALIGGWTKFPKVEIRDLGWLSLNGLFLAINGVANQIAFSLATYASYVIAIKRVSGLFGVGLGYLVFKEKGIKERAAGVLIIVAGVVILSVFG